MNLFWGIVLFCCGLAAMPAVAQERGGEQLETNATTFGSSPRDAAEIDSKRRYIVVINNDPTETLYGNRCAQEVTHHMGFEYVPLVKGYGVYRTGFSKFMYNSGAKLRLFFKNGPFWEMRAKKKIRDCKRKTGDFTG